MYIPFSQWLPDQFDLQNPGLEVAKNCLPGKDGFRAFKGFVRQSTNTIDGNAKGLFSTKDGAGTSFIFVGDEQKLYQYDASQTFQDVSRTPGYSVGTEEWDFASFDQTVIATNFFDEPQEFTTGVSTAFDDLGGSPPRAKFVATVKDFVLLGYTVDSTDGEQPTRIWRSPRNSPQGPWTPDPRNQCGFANIPDSGPITGLSGGAFGIALTFGGIHRLTYVGSPKVFERDEIGQGVGCEISGSVVRRVDARGVFSNIFFIGKDGFYISDGASVRQIGNDRVNQWFFDLADLSKKDQIRGGVFSLQDCVIWTFPSTGAADQNDLYIAFSYANNAWAWGELDIEILGDADSPQQLSDDIDDLSDDITTLSDASVWDASSNQFGAIDHAGYFGSFVGPVLRPVLETGDIRFIRDQKSRVGRITPDMDGVIATRVKSGEKASELGSFGPAKSMIRGFTSHRGTSKKDNLHRIEITGDETFTYASGLEVEVIASGN